MPRSHSDDSPSHHRSHSRHGEKRQRSREESLERRHYPHARLEITNSDAGHHHHHHRRGPTNGDDQPDLDLERPTTLNESCGLRIGLVNPRVPVTKQYILDEIDAVKVTHRVTYCQLEELLPGANPTHQWARVYFKTPDDADQCVTELNIPGRQCKWRVFVTQRLPLVPPVTEDSSQEPNETFQPFLEEPPDTISVDTQEGWVHFGTNELYNTKGLADCMNAKHMGKVIRRLICKHFDPQKRIACRFGSSCNFLHITAPGMNRLLRTVSHKDMIRIPKNEEEIQVSVWEFDRRRDTLVVRDLDKELDHQGLTYMFEACVGFQCCFLHQNRTDDRPYGIIRFDNQQNAFAALMQTFDSSLNVSFFGALEDSRMFQMKESKSNPGAGTPHNAYHLRGGEMGAQPSGYGEGNSPGSPRSLPFPNLPEGWVYGSSRRTGQYYFMRVGEKNKTSWKHPTTGESYSLN